jgi:hypothetical protein
MDTSTVISTVIYMDISTVISTNTKPIEEDSKMWQVGLLGKMAIGWVGKRRPHCREAV